VNINISIDTFISSICQNETQKIIILLGGDLITDHYIRNLWMEIKTKVLQYHHGSGYIIFTSLSTYYDLPIDIMTNVIKSFMIYDNTVNNNDHTNSKLIVKVR
jgi:hypothetical protein